MFANVNDAEICKNIVTQSGNASEIEIVEDETNQWTVEFEVSCTFNLSTLT